MGALMASPTRCTGKPSGAPGGAQDPRPRSCRDERTGVPSCSLVCIFCLGPLGRRQERNEGEWGKGGGAGGREGGGESSSTADFKREDTPGGGCRGRQPQVPLQAHSAGTGAPPAPSRRWQQEIQDPAGPLRGPHPFALGVWPSRVTASVREEGSSATAVLPPIAPGRQPPVITLLSPRSREAAGAEWPIPGGS
ncbi:myocyte-specific enhancer factor 2B-like [Ovis canadensis]|uniref:myocyte-specific enhancer factor 2B-like n=1 Tax=Ovis canadensis TaxID=37174 RepID=UPI00375144BD